MRTKRLLLSVFIIMTLILSSVCVSDASTKVSHAFSGSATHTDKADWDKWGSSTSSTKYNLLKTKKTVTSHTKYKGDTWYTSDDDRGWYAMTDNHHHRKNSVDLTYETSVTKTHTVSGSVSAKIKEIGVETGYSYSKTSASSVKQNITKDRASGDYFYGCRAKMIDLKNTKKVTEYKKKDGDWIKVETQTTYNSGAMICSSASNTGFYYDWRKQND